MSRGGFFRSNWITVALLIVGAALLALGVWRGEHVVVREKAVSICLECMGIG